MFVKKLDPNIFKIGRVMRNLKKLANFRPVFSESQNLGHFVSLQNTGNDRVKATSKSKCLKYSLILASNMS